jgi:phosphoglycolate phosphatase-like HAD superfamily hydrolase
MQAIRAVLFEPVGCLAEFRAEEFDRAARDLFGWSGDDAATGSQAYWRLLGLLGDTWSTVSAVNVARLADLEIAAVEHAELYEDVPTSLQKLQATGVKAYLVSSLSRRAVDRFIARFSLADMFTGSVTRDEAQGVTVLPLRRAVAQAAIDPKEIIALVDTAEALDAAKQIGLNALLMINDYDEGRTLAERHPAGGIVSLSELADALALIAQRSGLRSAPQMPNKPFEMFEPG